jgi:hypothetical protein
LNRKIVLLKTLGEGHSIRMRRVAAEKKEQLCRFDFTKQNNIVHIIPTPPGSKGKKNLQVGKH